MRYKKERKKKKKKKRVSKSMHRTPAQNTMNLYFSEHITKTCLYNFDSLKPHFYIVNLRFTGVHIIFLISAQKIECGYSLEPPRHALYKGK